MNKGDIVVFRGRPFNSLNRLLGIDLSEQVIRELVAKHTQSCVDEARIPLKNAKFFSDVARELGKVVQVNREDNDFPCFSYPVAMFNPDGTYYRIATTLPLWRRILDRLIPLDAQKRPWIDYPAYIGAA
jgi:uncharacterized protein YmfQ (DUF2313 family)